MTERPSPSESLDPGIASGPRPWRMIVTFLGFVLVLGGAVTGAVLAPRATPEKPAAETEAKPSEWFYQSLGKTPEGFGQKPGGRELPNVSYTIEIKVAESRHEAEKLIDMLAGLGVEAYYTPLARKGRVVYRVRTGIFPSRNAAEKANLALQSRQQIAGRVIKLQ